MKRILLLCLIGSIAIAAAEGTEGAKYEATWESIDSRPTPEWFDDARFGIFIHWGVYSVPAWGPKGKYSEWYWRNLSSNDGTREFHNRVYGEDFKYQDFAPLFKAEMFQPEQWAAIFKKSGAKYVVLTSKHHDGFCLWPSAESWNWNSVDTGPHRDLAGDLIEAVKDEGLRMGFYYSLYEWYHPWYKNDLERYVAEHMLPQIKDLVVRYEPDIVWGDGEWEHPSSVWKSTEFLAWLFNESPVKDSVAINDRWGKETRGVHGGYYTTEYFKVHRDTIDQYEHSWEECRGMGASFGYNRNEDLAEYKSATELLHILIQTTCNGGNLLLDIGPTGDGRIPVIMEERLVQMGEWLEVNGEAIYGTRPWRTIQEGEFVRYTSKGNKVYAICFEWPGNELKLETPKPTSSTDVRMLGYEGDIRWSESGEGIAIDVPTLAPDEMPCDHAYVFELTNVE